MLRGQLGGRVWICLGICRLYGGLLSSACDPREALESTGMIQNDDFKEQN